MQTSSKNESFISAYWFALTGICVTYKMKSNKYLTTPHISGVSDKNKFLNSFDAIYMKLHFLTPLTCSLIIFLPSILLFSQSNCKNLNALL